MVKNKKIINWTGILLIGILLFSFIFLASALTSEEEILQLENELVSSGFDWLINYSVEHPSVLVYLIGDSVGNGSNGASDPVRDSVGNGSNGASESVAVFENVSSEDWYKIYLSNLTGEEDVFDLRSINVKGGWI